MTMPQVSVEEFKEAARELAPLLPRLLADQDYKHRIPFGDGTLKVVALFKYVAAGQRANPDTWLAETPDSTPGNATMDSVSPANPNVVVGLAAAAKVLGVTRQSVHERVSRGTLPVLDRQGRTHLFDRRVLEAEKAQREAG